MELMNFSGARKIENMGTGLHFTALGHAITTGTAGAMIGAGVMKNRFTTAISEEKPGIHQAPAMSFDQRQNPTMGATGALTLALGDR